MVDTHFHSKEIQEKTGNLNLLLTKSFDEGLKYALDVGIDYDDYVKRKSLLLDFDNVFLACGIYPSHAEDNDLDFQLEQLFNTLQKNDVKAVGEIGIDLFREYGTKQNSLFHNQIELANKVKKPIIVHVRKSEKQILEVLQSIKPNYGGVIHSFSSSFDFAKKCMDMGFFISFSGMLTFKNNTALQDVLQKIPLSHLLFETDSPYLAPEGQRGKINFPGNVFHIYKFSAEKLKVDITSLKEKVRANFFRFLGVV